MTIPSLITKVQDYGFRSAFLKNYALIKNAYAMSIRDGVPFLDPAYSTDNHNENQNWPISPTYKQDPNLMKNYFKIQKDPVFTNWAPGSFIGFYPNMTDTNTMKYLNGQYVNKFLQNGQSFTFQLTDGTIISFCMWAYWTFNIFIDVNGAKGPNTYGRDIYWLQAPWDRTLKRYEIHPMGDIYTGGTNHSTLGQVYDEIGNTCKMNSTGLGCAYQIVKDRAYKIPKE